MRNFNFVLLCITSIVLGSKRSREEFENLSFEETRSALEDTVNILLLRSGNRMNIVRTELQDQRMKELLLSLGQLEVEAFDIISGNPTWTPEQLVEHLNAHIPAARTVSKRGFDIFRVKLWNQLIIRINDESVANDLGANTQVLTTDDGDITYLQFTDAGWNRFVLGWLVSKQMRPQLPFEMPQIIEPRKIADFETRLPPIAREYIHQRLAAIDMTSSDNLMSPLVTFEPRSILFRNLREYLLTVRSLGVLDPVAMTAVETADDSTDSTALSRQINARFNSSHSPTFNLLYSEERLKIWLEQKQLVKSFECATCGKVHIQSKPKSLSLVQMKQFILGPLTITGQPARITAEQVRVEWEKYERTQAPGGRFFIGVNTEIRRKKLSANFHLVSYPVVSVLESLGPVSNEVKRAALEFLNTTDPVGITVTAMRKAIAKFANERSLNSTQLYECAKTLASYMFIDLDIAEELARINRLRIMISPASIIDDAKRRGIDTKTTPERIVIFYKGMLEAIRADQGGIPFRTRYPQSGRPMGIMHHSIWQAHFVKPHLDLLTTHSDSSL